MRPPMTPLVRSGYAAAKSPHRAPDPVGTGGVLLVIRDAMNGTRTFTEFRRRTGTARSILAARLRKLVARGLLVQRTALPDRSRKYVIIDVGHVLFPRHRHAAAVESATPPRRANTTPSSSIGMASPCRSPRRAAPFSTPTTPPRRRGFAGQRTLAALYIPRTPRRPRAGGGRQRDNRLRCMLRPDQCALRALTPQNTGAVSGRRSAHPGHRSCRGPSRPSSAGGLSAGTGSRLTWPTDRPSFPTKTGRHST